MSTPSAPRRKPNREEMLTAAETLFAERGFGACSLRDVIGACNCSTTAFYSRFDSKDAVLEELVEGFFLDLHAATSERLAAVRGVEEGFDAGIDVLIETLGERKGLVRVALSEASALTATQGVLKRSLQLVAGLLEQGFRALRLDDPAARAWALVGALHLQVIRWAVFEEFDDVQLRENLTQAAQFFLPR